MSTSIAEGISVFMRVRDFFPLLILIFGCMICTASGAATATSQAKKWVTFPATGDRASYGVEADLLTKDKQGNEVLPYKWREIQRKLPPVDTVWVYVDGEEQHATPLKLVSIKDGKAHYKFGNGKTQITENVATYHRIKQPQSPRLPFPLHPGDRWTRKYTTQYNIPDINGKPLPVIEKAMYTAVSSGFRRFTREPL